MSDSNSQEKKFIPKYARTPEDLVFYTDTSQKDYPIYLLPNFEVRYKKRPADAERCVVFHVKHVERIDSYCAPLMYASLCVDATSKDSSIDEFIEKHGAELFKTIINTIEEKDRRVNVYAVRIIYEIYRGDYEELLGEAEAKALFLSIQPPYPLREYENRKFAITYSFLKRLLAKLPHIREKVEKLAYVTAEHSERKLGRFPVIKIKLPVPSNEFQELFEKAKKYLEEVEKPVEEVEDEHEPPIELPPLPEFKPRELTLEPSTTAVAPAPAEKPERSELVKIYLLNMRLPSKYLVQNVKIQSSGKNARELRTWEGVATEVASKLEGIRAEAEKTVRRVFCHVEEYGVWIAVTDEAVEEAKRISKFVTDKLQELMPKLSQVKNVDISRYCVKAVPVYLEPEDAKELLDAAVRKLSDDVEALAEKIKKAEEEKNKKALRRLQQDYNYRRNLLEAFKKFLESLPK
jgi:hypothetical protein